MSVNIITIKSAELSVLIRDPHEDIEQLGSRYCHGGYIWQVYDKANRPLLSGPHYPSLTPPPFDGQGMPEAFKIPELVQPCRWEIDAGGDYVVMTTGQESMTLRREVRVAGNCVKSTTAVRNISDSDVTILWFAHPFFPINNDLTCGKISPSVILPESAGYDIGPDGMIRMKPDYPWEKGLFQLLEVPTEKLNFAVPHPVVGNVTVQTDYPVTRCALWANANTFSFEPFTQRAVRPDEEYSWMIAYTFG